MFRLTKAVLNNLNQVPYITNVNNLELKDSNDSDKTSTKDLVKNSKYSLGEIINLETTVRTNNLKVFLKNYLFLRKERFLVVSLPAILSAATIAFCSIPNRYEDTQSANVYSGTHALYNSELGESQYTKDYLVRGDLDQLLFRYSADKDNLEEVYYHNSNSIYFKMYDDNDGVVATFNLSNNDKIDLADYSFGDYVDMTDYSSYDFSSNDGEYEELANRVLDILRKSDILTEEEKKLIDTLTESEKKIIIMEVSKYSGIEKKDVLMSKTRMPLKLLLMLTSAIYLIVEILLLKSRYPAYSVGRAPKIKNKNGELVADNYNSYCGLFFGPLKASEEFIAAEKDRIKRIKKELIKNVVITDDSKVSILSAYEKSLKPKKLKPKK